MCLYLNIGKIWRKFKIPLGPIVFSFVDLLTFLHCLQRQGAQISLSVCVSKEDPPAASNCGDSNKLLLRMRSNIWEWPLISVCFCWLLHLLPCLFLNFLFATAFMCNETAVCKLFLRVELFICWILYEKTCCNRWEKQSLRVDPGNDFCNFILSLPHHLCGHFKTKVYFKVPF